MGRHGGVNSTINRQRKKMAQRKGVSPRRITPERAASNLGFRIVGNRTIRPGFEIAIKQPLSSSTSGWSRPIGQTRHAMRPADNVEKALKRMKHWDSRTEQPEKRRNNKKRPRQTKDRFGF